MATKTITIKESAYKKLARWKEPGESFSDVIENVFDERILTTTDLLEWGRRNRGKKNALSQRKSAKRKQPA